MESGPITRLKNNNGFSVLEVLISVTIILIVATALVPLFVYVAQGTESNKGQLFATNLAQQVMEEIKQLPYEAFDENGNLITDDPSVPQIGTHPGGNPFGSVPKNQTIIGPRSEEYIVKTSIEWVDDPSSEGPGIDFKRIRVTVEAPNTFTGNISITEDVDSWVSKEGEKRVYEAGHMKINVMDSTSNPLSEVYTVIRLFDPDLTCEKYGWGFNEQEYYYANIFGSHTFGIIPEGDWLAKIKVPKGMIVRPDIWLETVTDLEGNFSFPRVADSDDVRPDHPGPYNDNDNIYIQNHVLVSNWETTDVVYDKLNYPSYLELKIKNIFTLEKEPEDWNIDSLKLVTPFREILVENITDYGGTINKNYLGPLWPQLDDQVYYSFGNIQFETKDEEQRRAFLVSTPPGSSGWGSGWNGTFDSPGQTKQLIIYIADFKPAILPTHPQDPENKYLDSENQVHVVSSNFVLRSGAHLVLGTDDYISILYIDNSTEEFLVKQGSSISGNGILIVRGDLTMEPGSDIGVPVYVSGIFDGDQQTQATKTVTVEQISPSSLP